MKNLLLLTTLLISSAAYATTPIPVRDFVKHSTYSGVKISPTGDYLAMTVDLGEQDVLTVLRTRDLSLVKVNQLPDKKSVGSFHWDGPERLIFNAVRKMGSFAQPFPTGEWFAVNADGTKPRPVIYRGTRDATQRGKSIGNERYSLLDPLINDPNNVLMMAIYPRSSEGAGTEAVLLDTVSGRRKTLVRAPRENCGFALDAHKEIRFALCTDSKNDQGEYDTVTELYRRNDDSSWALVNRSGNGGKQLAVFGAAADGRIYATQSDGKAPAAFGLLDRESAAFTPLFEDKVSEVAGYIVASDSSTILGVYTEAGAPQVTLTDEDHPDATLYLSLAAAFPGQMVNFSSATADGRQIVVSVYSDSNPGELYLYDRASGQARFLMQGRQWLDSKRMASVRPFAFTSRDGLTIHGYLTLPHGMDAKNLPLIVNPHGGPMGPRDNWAFNPETQLFASRGYAVLQVNFRGSGGFGKAFQDMAYGNWATGIMNDIIDATKWAISDGVADPNRICIYGGSFGGYSAMMAPAREPGLFKCAFGYVGAYSADIQMTLSDTSKSKSGLRYLHRALGKTEAEREAMSPVNHADKLKLPIMLAAGARDPRCPPEHTEAMRDALIKAGNPPEDVIIQSGEMHGFYNEDNRERLYTKMLAFFDRHIGSAHANKP